ncbi:C40 family peptidase [Timonella sp. A28]|uniref:C40 family peptidase n=1 Tax=Timonella sp. A28 TaxID=3442640 RepID=UPI003EB79C17
MSFDLALSRISEIRQSIDAVSIGAPATTAAAAHTTGSATAQSASAATALNSVASVLGGNTTHNLGASSTAETQFVQSLRDMLGTAGTSSATATTPTASGSTSLGEAVVEKAKTWIGVPYAWGGNTRNGVDCSGLVKNVLKEYGIDMPRVARQQMTMGTPVANLEAARPGDLVVFDHGKHIGIYAGDGKMVDAPKPGMNVQLRDVFETPTAIRRVLPNEPVAQPAQATPALSANERAAFEALVSSSLFGGGA